MLLIGQGGTEGIRQGLHYRHHPSTTTMASAGRDEVILSPKEGETMGSHGMTPLVPHHAEASPRTGQELIPHMRPVSAPTPREPPSQARAARRRSPCMCPLALDSWPCAVLRVKA